MWRSHSTTLFLQNREIQDKVRHTKLHALATTKNDTWFPLSSWNYKASRLLHRKSGLFTVRSHSQRAKLPPSLSLPIPLTNHATFALDGTPLQAEMQPVLCAVNAIPRSRSLETVLVHSTKQRTRSHESVSNLLAARFGWWWSFVGKAPLKEGSRCNGDTLTAEEVSHSARCT